MVSTAIEEGRGAALAVHRFFQGSPLEPLDREVVVDQGLCTLCLTCLRFCPHQAIGWTHRIFIHLLACRRCGICAGECPMDAIQIDGFSDLEAEQRVAGDRRPVGKGPRPGNPGSSSSAAGVRRGWPGKNARVRRRQAKRASAGKRRGDPDRWNLSGCLVPGSWTRIFC